MNTLSGTTKLIMDVFSRKGIRKHHHLSLLNLFYEQFQWHKDDQDNFLDAIHDLVSEGLLKWGESYKLILTDEGHGAVHHPHPGIKGL